MTENDLYKKFLIAYEKDYLILWKSPSYKIMRWDIFGIFDIISVVNKQKIEFIQLTTLSNLSHRRKKIHDKFMEIGFNIPNSYIFAWDNQKGIFKIEKQIWQNLI